MSKTTRCVLGGACILVLLAVVTLLGWGLFGWFSPAATEDSSVLATVNGKEIARTELDDYRHNAQFSLQNGREQLKTMQGLTDEQKAAMEAELEASADMSDEDILNDLIRQEVMLQEAQRQGLEVSADAAYEAGKAAYTTIKELATAPDAPQDAVRNYEVIKDYMQANDLSEETYWQQVGRVYQASMTRTALYESWAASATGSSAEAFDAYVDSLVEKADVKRP